MFQPDRQQVRRFFCDAWRKRREREPVTPLESMALDWIDLHPEYHRDLDSVDDAVAADYTPETGRTNPFLHLSMHLAISEQLQIDQPPGIRGAFEALVRRTGSHHDAAHVAMECLGETLWEAQRTGTPLSNERYVERLHARAGTEAGPR